jgi:AhpD family alkylhydroperoxidase
MGILEVKKELNQKYVEFYKEAFRTGTLSWKEKELIAIGVALGAGCERCYKFHLERAIKAGATEEEVREAIGIAEVVMAGTVRGMAEEQ